mmetsp:Transcript_2826/g.6683  ORF Transcript_2826/g.6683 Transcript_2826/m.6683 type:complete len:98 (-) Transcript_2826:53-346(-)
MLYLVSNMKRQPMTLRTRQGIGKISFLHHDDSVDTFEHTLVAVADAYAWAKDLWCGPLEEGRVEDSTSRQALDESQGFSYRHPGSSSPRLHVVSYFY